MAGTMAGLSLSQEQALGVLTGNAAYRGGPIDTRVCTSRLKAEPSEFVSQADEFGYWVEVSDAVCAVIVSPEPRYRQAAIDVLGELLESIDRVDSVDDGLDPQPLREYVLTGVGRQVRMMARDPDSGVRHDGISLAQTLSKTGIPEVLHSVCHAAYANIQSNFPDERRAGIEILASLSLGEPLDHRLGQMLKEISDEIVRHGPDRDEPLQTLATTLAERAAPMGRANTFLVGGWNVLEHAPITADIGGLI